jgi:aldose 1-epimerase
MNENLWQIENDEIRCTLSDFGAAIEAVRVRDGAGRLVPVALSRENFHPGQTNRGMAGRSVGPCCGRVAEGEIEIDGQRLRLTPNEGPNHIHGGPGGVGSRVWQGERLSPTRVRFALALPDGLDGYPGNRTLRAEYAVEGNLLSVIYSAFTDRATWVDMTNHVYWDLGGRFDGSALDQVLEINAKQVVFNGEGHLPAEILPVEGPFDFTRPATLAENMKLDPAPGQLVMGRGYNNALLLDDDFRRTREWAARLYAPSTGIRMTMDTDQPAIVLYSGGFLNEKNRIQCGAASPGCAVALEAQQLPDPFHLPGASHEPLRPGDRFRRKILWRFETL